MIHIKLHILITLEEKIKKTNTLKIVVQANYKKNSGYKINLNSVYF